MDWYERMIEKPMRTLVKLLRENGFNTYCSCGHYPNPYVRIEWYDDNNISDLWLLLADNGYKNWVLYTTWAYDSNFTPKLIEIKFYPKSDGESDELVGEKDLME